MNQFVITESTPAATVPLYGRLYNWYAVAGLAPSGWHVPTQVEWATLVTYLGGEPAYKLREIGTEHWASPNTGASNSSGFTALPSGYRKYDTGGFISISEEIRLWSSTATNATNAVSRGISYNVSTVSESAFDKNAGHSIRLVRDNSTGWTSAETITDEDGNVYSTVQIGSQIWTVQNWACTKLADGTPIENVTDNTEWIGLGEGAYCDYDNEDTYVYETPETNRNFTVTVTDNNKNFVIT